MADDLARIAARLECEPQPIWLWDAERCRIVWANAAGRAFWGAKSLFDLANYPYAADAPDIEAMAGVGQDRKASLTPPGGAVHATLEIAAVRFPGIAKGRLVRVTEWKRVPPKPSVTLRSDLFLAAPAALALVDVDGGIIDANRSWRALTGVQADRIAVLVGVGDAVRFLHQCVVSGRGQLISERSGRRLRFSGKRIARARGRLPLIYLQVEDVTVPHTLEMFLTRRAAEASSPAPIYGNAERLADVERKSQAKTDFIAKLSHEMRTPLNAIIGFSEIMQRHHFGPLGDARYEAYAGDINTSANHLLSLVNDLLDMARIEAGQLHLEFEGVSLPSLIEECARLLRPQSDASGVVMVVMAPANLPPVVADARSLKQILINLVSNALKFTPRSGTVRIAAELSTDGGVVLSVNDTGIGMSSSEIQRALEPYGQIDGPMQKGRKGTGLGLPVAKALAEANKAIFKIESVPQRGTQVQMIFPPTRVLAG